MTSVEALARVTKPAVKRRRRAFAVGDGLPCPDGHGPLLRLRGSSRQYCPHHDHDRLGTPCFFAGAEA